MSQEDLEGQDWSEISRRMTAYTLRRLGKGANVEDAKEIAQEAFTQLLSPDYRDWDPEEQPDLKDHLRSVINGLVMNRWRKRSGNETLVHQHPLESLPNPDPGGNQTPESVAAERIDGRRALDLLLDRVAGDGLCEGVILLFADGVDKPAEQAVRLDQPVAAIYNARRRLQGHLGATRALLKGGTNG